VEHCSDRGDDWGLEVLGRLSTCCDLVAVEAIYHRSCYIDFVCMHPRPTTTNEHQSNGSKPGRPVDKGKMEAFENLCSWLELCDDEMYYVYT